MILIMYALNALKQYKIIVINLAKISLWKQLNIARVVLQHPKQ
jgi:hypothetical protein